MTEKLVPNAQGPSLWGRYGDGNGNGTGEEEKNIGGEQRDFDFSSLMRKYPSIPRGKKDLPGIREPQQFNREFFERDLFPLVRNTKKKAYDKEALKGKEAAVFFYEPSTRTRYSFHTAIHRLGGAVVFSTENAKVSSSVVKGESIEDTVLNIAGYGPDVIIMRTDEEGSIERAARVTEIPIINAGDGIGTHPTQTATDIYTIEDEQGHIDRLHIVLCGDLVNGRTANSLAYSLSDFDVTISLVSTKNHRLKQGVKDHLKEKSIKFEEFESLAEVARDADVFYLTRPQLERGTEITPEEEENCCFDQRILSMVKPTATILHPQPRNDELDKQLDGDRRVAIFRQSANGLPVRMALLLMLLG